jgi:predicted RNA-binding protein with PUA-like domain
MRACCRYFDPESPQDNPKWFCVDVKARTHTHIQSHTFTHHATAHSHHIHTSFLHTAQFVKPLGRMLSLAELQSKSEALPEHADFISQPRLCVFPAPKDEWDVLIEQMPKAAPPTHLVGAPETPGARGGA